MPLDKETSTQPIELDQETLDRFKAHILARFDAMKKYRDQIDLKVIEWLKLYNCVPATKKYTWQSNVFVPYVFSLIQTLLPRLMGGLFGARKIVACEARSEEFLGKEEKLASWFESQLEQNGFRRKARESVLAALKYPMAIIKNRWVMKESVEVRRILFKRYANTVKTGAPDFEVVNFFDFWWDPEATSIDNCRDVIHRVVRDQNHLKVLEKEGVYRNIGPLSGTTMPDDIVQIKQDVDIYNEDAAKENTNRGYNPKELLEYWGKFDINGDGIDEDVVGTIGNREVMIRWGKNVLWGPPLPFTVIAPMVEDSQLTGMPSIKIMSSLQNELNTVRNQRIDNVSLILRKLWKMRTDAGIDLNTVFAGPGNVIPLENMDDLEEFQVKDVTQNAQMEELAIVTDMKQALGISEYWMGNSAKSSDTARGMQLLTTEMATRVEDMIQNMSAQFERVFQKMALMCKQFMAKDTSFRTVQDGKTAIEKLTVDEIMSNYRFKLILKTQEAAPMEKQAQLVQLLNILGKFPWINIPELTRSILESFQLMNIDKIFDSGAYAENLKAQMAKAVMGQAGPAAGMGPEQLISAIGKLDGPMDPTLPAISPTGLGPLPRGQEKA